MVSTQASTGANDAKNRLLLDVQARLLEVLVSDVSVHQALNTVVLSARDLMGEQRRIAIFIKNPAENHLRFAAAAGLHEHYTQAIDNFPIGPAQPSCGQAAYTGHDVLVRDVAEDPFWAPYVALAEQYGIRACWSFVLKGKDGHPIGTFAVYHATPAEPDEHDYKVIRFFARIASLLVLRHIAQEDRARSYAATERLLTSANQNLLRNQAIAVHELRNPLHAMKMAVQIMEKANRDNTSQERLIPLLQRQLAAMGDLLQQMAQASVSEPAAPHLNKSSAVLQDLVNNAVEAMRSSFDAKSQILSVRLAPVKIDIDADASRLTQIISNLLSNACKFTGVGGRIDISAAATVSHATIVVTDNGTGLAPEHLETIFDIYTRIDPHAPDAPAGNGIGLNIVRELAALHGGSVTATSGGLGTGSSFTVTLPLHMTNVAPGHLAIRTAKVD